MKLEVPGLIPSRGIGIFTLIILRFCSLVFDVQYEFKSVSLYISMFVACPVTIVQFLLSLVVGRLVTIYCYIISAKKFSQLDIGFPESSSRRPFLGCPHPSRSRVSVLSLRLVGVLSTLSPPLVSIALRYLLSLSSRVNSGVICIGSII